MYFSFFLSTILSLVIRKFVRDQRVETEVEGLNFEQHNYRMSDVANLKINERSNVEHPNLRVIKIGHKNSEVKASKLVYIKGQI